MNKQKPPSLEATHKPAGRAEMVLGSGSPIFPRIPEHALIRQIAAGSYGEVWLAQHSLGTYRAVKIVSRSRFTHERPYDREFRGIQKFEPISRRHPGLINVLFVGRDVEAGYFYYIMELADDAAFGSQIAPERYRPKTLADVVATRKRIPVAECITVGLQITSALAFLHEQVLTHRDIKPSNIIFVGGEPKLADIGLVTDLGEARSYVGTEGFIPPEGPGTVQADIYSLGKVLYEISTGKDRHQYPALPPELDERTQEQDFLEFNEVVLKACRADPAERYGSAGEMRDDLLLLQSGNSLKQFRVVQRRLKLATRLGAMATLIAVAAIATYVFTHREFLRERLRRQTLEALQSVNRLQEINNHVVQLFARSDLDSMLRTLDKAAQRSLTQQDAPEVQLQTLRALASAYSGMGQYEKSEAMLRQALPIARSLYGDASVAAAQVLVSLADGFTDESDPKRYAEGENLCRQSLAIIRKELGNDSYDLSTALLVYGDLLMRKGKMAESEAAVRESWGIRRRLLGHDHFATVGSWDAVAAAVEQAGRLPEAERMFREVLDCRRRLMNAHSGVQSTLDVAHTLNHVGVILCKQNRTAEAETPLSEALALRSKLLGDHPDTADSLSRLAGVLAQLGKLSKAGALYRQELDLRTRLGRPDYEAQVAARSNLAQVIQTEARLGQAGHPLTEISPKTNLSSSLR